MSTIIPAGERTKQAVAWIAENRELHPEKPLSSLLDEAGMRFNLTPLETQKLEQVFRHD